MLKIDQVWLNAIIKNSSYCRTKNVRSMDSGMALIATESQFVTAKLYNNHRNA
tara:strand:+ start:436 stop:594 length:159 start_codon:yes stop_codon:yes gene_type:complete